jgi:mono/diheme cytochrome c family protein|tara:strand:- start:293 stop:604 length:312 start_codon:yes stop_codon:yes gene_type:complete
MKIKLSILFVFIFIFITDGKSDEIFDLGKDIFLNSGNCATCHSLKDAGSVANVGPNLNEIRPEFGRIQMAVTNGIGVMPSMLGILSEDEIKAVSHYVAISANN